MWKMVNLFNLFLNLYFTSTIKSGTIIKKEGRIWNYYLDFIKKQTKKRIEL